MFTYKYYTQVGMHFWLLIRKNKLLLKRRPSSLLAPLCPWHTTRKQLMSWDSGVSQSWIQSLLLPLLRTEPVLYSSAGLGLLFLPCHRFLKFPIFSNWGLSFWPGAIYKLTHFSFPSISQFFYPQPTSPHKIHTTLHSEETALSKWDSAGSFVNAGWEEKVRQHETHAAESPG